MTTQQTLTGADDLKRALLALPDKLRRRLLRNALAAGARVVRNAAQAQAPVLSGKSKYRTPGLLRKSIKVRTSKRDRSAGNVGVFINVKPVKGQARGAKSTSDPYYWRWIEFGRAAGMTKRKSAIKGAKPSLVRVGAIAPAQFLQAGAGQFSVALKAIETGFVKEIAKLNRGTP